MNAGRYAVVAEETGVHPLILAGVKGFELRMAGSSP